MISYELWRDTQTGDVWAVRFDDGVVDGVCGPLDDEEADPGFLDCLDYSHDAAAALDPDRDRYTLYEPVGSRRTA